MWWSKKILNAQSIVTAHGIILRKQSFRTYTRRGQHGKVNRDFARQLSHEMKLLMKKAGRHSQWYRQPINNNKYVRIKAI